MFVRGYLRASTKDQDASRARKHGVQDHGPPPEAEGQTRPASSMRDKRHKFATGPSLKGPPSAGRRGNLVVALAAPTPADIYRPSNEARGAHRTWSANALRSIPGHFIGAFCTAFLSRTRTTSHPAPELRQQACATRLVRLGP